MRIRALVAGSVVAWASAGTALAGGLFLPGAGVVSTSRAGASVAATDDGEAIAINPAGLAKVTGTYITIGAVGIDYAMSFQRTGDYDVQPNDTTHMPEPYDGTRYPKITNKPRPSTGIGPVQPVPMVALVSDLGGKIPGLHVAVGVYAPNGYPFRDMSNGYTFNSPADAGVAPPPTRYDIVKQSASVILPTIAASYRILPNLDVGAKFSAGIASIQSTTAIWGVPGNFTEFVGQDGQFTVNAHDHFIPVWGLGATYRPTPNIELGAQYSSQITINATGTATTENGPQVSVNGIVPTVGPTPDARARCATGGTAALLKACVDLALPQMATVGGRWKFLDKHGNERGDIELDLDWENWSADPAQNYNVTVDADIFINGQDTLTLKDSEVRHGFQDTYAARLGGSYRIPVASDTVIVRGGVSYDTAAAKPGWERVDIDGAARTTLAAGASYRMHRVQIDAGFSAVIEGTRTNPGNCNPTAAMQGCDGTGVDTPVNQRTGPDAINPLLDAQHQAQNPVNQGVIASHYLEFMLGVSTWF